jgi:hypothetical protein
VALAPLLPVAGEQGCNRHTRAWKSGFRLVPRTASGARTAGSVMCYAVSIAGLLTTGRVTDGTPGLLIAAVLVVIATPVIGFTWNQVTLTEKGRQLAGTVAEIRSLKQTDSEAFTALIAARYGPAAIRRQLDDPGAESGQSCTYTCQGQGCGHYLCDSSSASIPHVPLRASFPSFWESLTDAERSWLLAAAHTVGFPAGAVLCRQDEPGVRIFVIASGQVVIYVTQPGEHRRVAIRGTGDIVGERAAFELRPRSATVVALVAARALAITTSDFAAFIERHPRVLAVLERQVYDRLVEDRPVEPKFYLDGIATGQPAWSGLNCSIFLADIAAFGRHSRNDKDRQLLRSSMYATLQHAFESSGVPWHSCYREDRGDGVLVIVPPSTPTRLLIDPLSDDIAMTLAIHNDQATEALRMQLRVALHVGPVLSDPEGVSGESIILAARILEAPVLKRQLASEAADLGLIVSAYVYDTVVKHGPGRIDPARYRQVRVQLKESRLNAWICLSSDANPGKDVLTPATSAAVSYVTAPHAVPAHLVERPGCPSLPSRRSG